MAKTSKAPGDPMMYRRLAERYLSSVGHSDSTPAVRWWRQAYWFWVPPRWVEHDLNNAVLVVLKWLSSNNISSIRSTAEGVVHMLGALTRAEGITKLPCWYPPVATSLGDHWVAMRNTLVNPEKLARGDAVGSTHPLTSRWFSTVALPYDYNPSAEWPMWLATVEDRFGGDLEAIAVLQEFFGYWIVPDTRQHAVLMLVGESGTGKSSILEVAEMLVGRGNCSHVPLADFSKNFALIETDGKLLNICDETGDLPKAAESTLKWYVSGRPISVDGKYRPRYSMTPTARLAVGINTFPRFHDMSGGIWRRLHVLSLRKVIPYEEKIIGYADRLLPEQSGIFNWSIQGLSRLRRQGRFTLAGTGRKELAHQQASAQTHREFVAERVKADPSGFLPNTLLLGHYKSWCLLDGVDPTATLHDLQREIQQHHPHSELGGRQYYNGRRQRGIAGVVYHSGGGN